MSLDYLFPSFRINVLFPRRFVSFLIPALNHSAGAMAMSHKTRNKYIRGMLRRAGGVLLYKLHFAISWGESGKVVFAVLSLSSRILLELWVHLLLD